MENFDYDLRSIQEARDLARRGSGSKEMAGHASGRQIDMGFYKNMVGTAEERGALARMAVETGCLAGG